MDKQHIDNSLLQWDYSKKHFTTCATENKYMLRRKLRRYIDYIAIISSYAVIGSCMAYVLWGWLHGF